MEWLRYAAAGRQAVRSHAAPGGDQMEATFEGRPADSPVAAQGDLAWDLGIAPTEWNSAVIAPLYKVKGPRDAGGPCVVCDTIVVLAIPHARLAIPVIMANSAWSYGVVNFKALAEKQHYDGHVMPI
eukprot:366336-Chlamydomonas_euryale.AAC.13